MGMPSSPVRIARCRVTVIVSSVSLPSSSTRAVITTSFVTSSPLYCVRSSGLFGSNMLSEASFCSVFSSSRAAATVLECTIVRSRQSVHASWTSRSRRRTSSPSRSASSTRLIASKFSS